MAYQGVLRLSDVAYHVVNEFSWRNRVSLAKALLMLLPADLVAESERALAEAESAKGEAK